MSSLKVSSDTELCIADIGTLMYITLMYSTKVLSDVELYIGDRRDSGICTSMTIILSMLLYTQQYC